MSLANPALAAEVHPGQSVYDRVCAASHNAPEPGSRAAPVASLRQMDARTLRTSLTTGVMKGIGDSLAPDDLRAVVDYLAIKPKPISDDWIETARCPADRRAVDAGAAIPSGGFGIAADNRRRLTAALSGLTTASLAGLKPAWTLAIPNATTLRSQPVLLGSTLFYAASQASTLLALDAGTGCIKWAAKTPSGIRTSLAIGRLGKAGPLAVVGGDEGGHLQAWEAATGKLLWRADPRHDEGGVLTGAPVFAGEKLIVPISALDVAQAMRPTFACCSTHGAVSTVDATSGKVIWTWHATPDAKPLGVKNSAGVEMRGPSGAPVWSTPAVDLKRGLVLAGPSRLQRGPEGARPRLRAGRHLGSAPGGGWRCLGRRPGRPPLGARGGHRQGARRARHRRTPGQPERRPCPRRRGGLRRRHGLRGLRLRRLRPAGRQRPDRLPPRALTEGRGPLAAGRRAGYSRNPSGGCVAQR